MSPTLDALDRIDNITVCLEAVSDLLLPETDLHAVNRDKQAVLLAFLVAELQAARQQLSRATRPDNPVIAMHQ